VKAAALFALFLLAGTPSFSQDLGFRGWGVRGGLSDNPDQVVVGVQTDFGEFIPRLAFRPHLDLGLGDDTTVIALGVPVLYRLPIEGSFTLYGGGGLIVGLIDKDDEDGGLRRDDDGNEVDISPLLAGGVEWPIGRGDLGIELNAAGGDLPRVKLLGVWSF
jgi:hypothetical protein